MSEEKESKYVESKMTIRGVAGTVKDKSFDEISEVEVGGKFHALKRTLEKAKAAAKLEYNKNINEEEENRCR